MQITHRDTSPRRELPGRTMIDLISPQLLGARNLSVCTVTLQAGQRVRPAHRHPLGEEVIYILQGEGQVFVRHEGQDEVQPLTPGTAVLFRPEDIHMLRNTGSAPLEALCVYAPPSDPSQYELHEGIEFPGLKPLG